MREQDSLFRYYLSTDIWLPGNAREGSRSATRIACTGSEITGGFSQQPHGSALFTHAHNPLDTLQLTREKGKVLSQEKAYSAQTLSRRPTRTAFLAPGPLLFQWLALLLVQARKESIKVFFRSSGGSCGLCRAGSSDCAFRSRIEENIKVVTTRCHRYSMRGGRRRKLCVRGTSKWIVRELVLWSWRRGDRTRSWRSDRSRLGHRRLGH